MKSEDFRKAHDEVEQILGATRPKHLGQGLTSGVGYILRGAVGACGAVVVRFSSIICHLSDVGTILRPRHRDCCWDVGASLSHPFLSPHIPSYSHANLTF